MSASDCPKFDACSAPICPKDAESTAHCAWFPDEDVCPLRDVPTWVRRQRRIAKAVGKNAAAGCFTAKMLAHPCVIRPGIKGLDPETAITESRVSAWVGGRSGVRKQRASEHGLRPFRKGESRAERTTPAVVVKSVDEGSEEVSST